MKATFLAIPAALAPLSLLPFWSAEPAPAAATAPAEAHTYAIDAGHSAVIFRVKHFGVGYTYGRFNELGGSVTFDERNPAASSVEIEVKANSIDSNSEGRDDHLRGPDFLSSKEFPLITFKSSKVEKKGDGYAVTGDLSLHGVSKTITVDAEHVGTGPDPWGNERVGFELKFDIEPKDYEIRYMTDKDTLGPGIGMIVSIEASRKP
ncbi:MAG: YceI family protein [Planctomycetota bacterium]